MSSSPPRRPSTALSGLPRHFIDAMRRLFRILDSEGRGWIQVKDVSSRWNPASDSASHLPANFLEHLDKMATQDGRLSFERFMAGIKIAILRHEAAKNKVEATVNKTGSMDRTRRRMMRGKARETEENMGARANSLPNLLDAEDALEEAQPLLIQEQQYEVMTGSSGNLLERRAPMARSMSLGPPKPPRNPLRASRVFTRSATDTRIQSLQPSSADYANVYVNMEAGPPLVQVEQPGAGRRFTAHSRRGSAVSMPAEDLTLTKRMKQWETERNVLLEATSVAKTAQTAFEGRLLNVEQKMASGVWHGVDSVKQTEAEEERTMFEFRAIRDLSYRLGQLSRPGSNLVSLSSDSNSQSDSNPAREQQQQQQLSVLQNQVQRLKDQNRQLTAEVGLKSNDIAGLEGEKSLLIKQLFQAKSGMGVSSARQPLATVTQSASNIKNGNNRAFQF